MCYTWTVDHCRYVCCTCELFTIVDTCAIQWPTPPVSFGSFRAAANWCCSLATTKSQSCGLIGLKRRWMSPQLQRKIVGVTDECNFCVSFASFATRPLNQSEAFIEFHGSHPHLFGLSFFFCLESSALPILGWTSVVFCWRGQSNSISFFYPYCD